MSLKKLVTVLVLFQFYYLSYGQNSGATCTAGINFEELISVFNLRTKEKISNRLEQICFRKIREDNEYTIYERIYNAANPNVNRSYNELFIISGIMTLRYRCTEGSLCDRLLNGLYDNTALRFEEPANPDGFSCMLNNKMHVIEFQNIPDKNIGYAYEFKFRDVNSADLALLKELKSGDSFAKSDVERQRLEYKYKRIYSVDSPATITVRKGDKLRFEAEGQILLGTFAGTSGPLGIEGFTGYSRVAEQKHGSLLYKIGEGKWEPVGLKKEITVLETGKLSFMVNDSEPSNNEGNYFLMIRMIRVGSEN